MKINGNGFRMSYENGGIRISGKLSMMLEDYSEIEAFFESIVASRPDKLTLDIRELEYLNSSGIKVICVNLILEAAEINDLSMTIRCSNRFTWQKETVPTFKELMDHLEIDFDPI
jgi:hypothetical protein